MKSCVTDRQTDILMFLKQTLLSGGQVVCLIVVFVIVVALLSFHTAEIPDESNPAIFVEYQTIKIDWKFSSTREYTQK